MVKNRVLVMLNSIYKRKIESLFPQLCLRIFLVTPVSLASEECSFRKLALIRNRLCSSMLQDMISSLHRVVRQMDYEKSIDNFKAHATILKMGGGAIFERQLGLLSP